MSVPSDPRDGGATALAPGDLRRDATRLCTSVDRRAQDTLHATCVAVGEVGVLIRGASGAGKSSLALALLDRAAADGRFAALVADDRVRLAAVNGRLLARPHPAIAGQVEVRGHGIVAVASLPVCVLRLVVDLIEALPRLPPSTPEATVLGIALPCLAIDRALRDAGLAPTLVLAASGVSSQPHSQVPAACPSPAP